MIEILKSRRKKEGRIPLAGNNNESQRCLLIPAKSKNPTYNKKSTTRRVLKLSVMKCLKDKVNKHEKSGRLN